MLKLNWEPDARVQYATVIDFVAAHNPDAADRLATVFDEAFERACQFPYIGRPGRIAGTRELIVHPNYLAIYQITPDAIDVLRILHARQLYP